MVVGVGGSLFVGFLKEIAGLGVQSNKIVVSFWAFGFLQLLHPFVWWFGWAVVAFATKKLVSMMANASKRVKCEGEKENTSVVHFLEVIGCNDIVFAFQLGPQLAQVHRF